MFETGMVIEYIATSPPKGWLWLDGSIVDVEEFYNLYLLLLNEQLVPLSASGKFQLPTQAGKIIKV